MNSLTQLINQLLSPETGGAWNAVFAIFLAYLGGILSSLTPCVYPMIPITIGVVGGAGPARRPWQEIWIRGAAYVAGMAIIYSFLGVLAGLTGKVFGTLTNTPGWYIGLGTIITLAALTMLDIIPFDPQMMWEGFKRKIGMNRKPSTHGHAAQGTHHRPMSMLGAFGLGASSGFIAAPCTTPVLTTILAYIAKTQSIGLGLSLMLAFSVGLGTILLIVAAFAGAIQSMPRSGLWMKHIKTASGIILLIFAEYLIYRAGALGGL
jgi:thiol:disulfide interchange protein DsbD